MKTVIAEGMFQGVLDITTAEVGAYVLDAESSSAGEDRLDAAVLAGLPQVVSVGGMDVIGIRVDQLHTKFQGYKPYSHNDKPDMIRTRPEDGIRIGQFMCRHLNNSIAPCAIYLPIRSLSSLDAAGGQTLRRRGAPAALRIHQPECRPGGRCGGDGLRHQRPGLCRGYGRAGFAAMLEAKK